MYFSYSIVSVAIFCSLGALGAVPKTTGTRGSDVTNGVEINGGGLLKVGVCTSNGDCPAYAPCCSKFGYCGDGPDYCQNTTTEAPTTTTSSNSGPGECVSDKDCPTYAPCCSEFG